MDEKPSTSTEFSPIKKRKRLDLGHLSVAEKQSILNMFKSLRKSSDKNMTAIVGEISHTLGVAKSTVYRVVKEYKQKGFVTSSNHYGGRPQLVATFNEYVKNSVRRIVHEFFHRNELPTLDKILEVVKRRPDLPPFSRSSLYKLMKLINFKYLKRNRRSILIERDHIIRWRRRYLRTIKQYRKEDRIIYYLDETWLNEGHTKEKVWVDSGVENQRQAFLEDLSTGLKNPTGKGRRLITLHCGSEHGFVDDALLLFEGKKSSDYHEEMNATVFEEWFAKLLNKLPENAVIVMDNASYHSRKLHKIPTSSSRKQAMQEWLESRNISFDPDMVRSELLHLINQHKEKYNSYVTDEMAKKNNKIVLRLPPYHCELNPIELIWAKIKNEVASKNTTFKLNDVKHLYQQAVQNVTCADWKNCVEHVIKEEEKMCKVDGIMDDLIEPFIISVGNGDSSSSESSSDEDC